MIRKLTYSVQELMPYVNWVYFYHAWGLSGKPEAERLAMRNEAENLCKTLGNSIRVHALFGLFDANSEGDDIVVGGVRLPMLRQQHPSSAEGHCLCLADFVRPSSSGVSDQVGVFAASVDSAMEKSHSDDPYMRMLSQTMADRLAEAAAERLHEEVRKSLWGYAPDEHLDIEQMLREEFQGIRPAVGYPSMPDTSLNFLLSDLIGMKSIGIRLTESGMMQPHASVSGLMLAHPQACYFDVGKVGEDQLEDYARRRGLPLQVMRQFIK